ncbi:MAG: flagellar basal body P-ring protein FlgI [Legionellaceae bacterium]|nr:flagellar basal body P-ring protein FlgI [Legionellaceae bacterium]
MIIRIARFSAFFAILCMLGSTQAGVAIKSIARLADVQENPLTGYGLVIGLAGTGDTRRSKDTMQAIANVLLSFGVNIPPGEINSRNTATVMVTTNLPAFAHTGDKLDVHVSSLGDARSLLGGTLLVTPLKGPDERIYALAQGSVSIGGFKYDLYGNIVQKNHPTSGLVTNGAIVEKTLYNSLFSKMGTLHYILHHPDFTTADRMEQALNQQFGSGTAQAKSAQEVEVKLPKNIQGRLIRFVSQIENTEIIPGSIPTVVVNERTGIVVAGSDVRIDSVTISHGNLQLAISTEYHVSQPTLLANANRHIKTAVVPSTQIHTSEPVATLVNLPNGATVSDLIKALAMLKTSTRDVISILESLKRAGALHAELIIQ